jgi:hypothetical protein
MRITLVGPFVLLLEVAQVIEELDNRTKKETENGWKDNRTPAWRKKLQQNKNKKAFEVSNPKIQIGLYIRFEYDCKKVVVEVVFVVDLRRVFQMEM